MFKSVAFTKFATVLLLLIFTIPDSVYAQRWSENFVDQPLAVQRVENVLKQVAWNPDGTVLAAASDDGVIVYSDELQPLTQIRSGELIEALTWSPDGSQLAITHGKTVEIWNWDEAAQVLSLKTTLASDGTQITIVWSPDGSQIVSIGTYDYLDTWIARIFIWDTSAWQLEQTLVAPYSFSETESPERVLAWDTSGTSLFAFVGNRLRQENDRYVYDSNQSLFIVDSQTGQMVEETEINGDLALAIAWQPFGEHIAIAKQTGVSLYDLQGTFLKAFFVDYVEVLDWSPNGRYLAGETEIADIEDDGVIGGLWKNYPLQSIDWNPDGRRIAMITLDEDGMAIQIHDASVLPGFVPPNDTQPTLTAAPE